ncbi:MAG: hypothetical protein PHO34_00120 [Candidatus Omnitrophica bacterium]|nr:hypothetical protein [Candidatus Omnitrophota bacterium]MDD5042312.1 hypothetical protein [Candidatus Omnitrophota bacterium]MDD5500463.1 hypothetical protein [Candidatus Omnitrophota bacterium]
MSYLDELNKKTDEELIEYILKQCFMGSGEPLAERNREVAKAILNCRSAKITQQQNEAMIKLTKTIKGLTWVMLILTVVLLVKTFL